ncbi:hemolysin III [Mumia flava]|uniref:Hemolysin III n=1 Tax=Mumia flava TaxID=1348852 RepID=A0A2M9BFS5_9ACTN|nr:hemolysin III family protein [Mumia flava]PJJ56800.1 hemolysin III [Mumia flava]
MSNHEVIHASGLDVGTRLRDAVDEIKPRLRGWLHAATWPLALAAFVVLLVLAPGAASKTGVAVYMASALLLFGVSAVYHVGRWGPRAQLALKRVDHANIFLLIAGSYTPFALILLEPRDAAMLLAMVWGGALGGVAFRVFWVDAPRWLYTPMYVMLGWAAVLWREEFVAATSTAVIVLIVVGGVLYSLGAVVYGLRRPDPFPRWFGFHEVFHTLTIAAFVTHYVGISIAAYALR